MAATQEPRDYIAEAARLLREAGVGTLATVADGLPNAALVTPALAPDGAPRLLLSTLAVHTRQLAAHPACSLLLVGAATNDNPQTAPRLCLSGRAAVAESAAARGPYLARHPYAALYADFADFSFWRLEVTRAQYIGGFAAAAALDPDALRRKISTGVNG